MRVYSNYDSNKMEVKQEEEWRMKKWNKRKKRQRKCLKKKKSTIIKTKCLLNLLKVKRKTYVMENNFILARNNNGVNIMQNNMVFPTANQLGVQNNNM